MSNGIAGSTASGGAVPSIPTERWLARENAFDTAHRVYKKLHRDSDGSHYSREQDYDEVGDEMKSLPSLSPSSPEWNASRFFWTVRRSNMWVDHVANSGWPTVDLDGQDNKVSTNPKTLILTSLESGTKPDKGPVISAEKKSENRQEKPGNRERRPKNRQESKAETKSTAAKLPCRPKLTIQIPSGTSTYVSKFSKCKPRIMSQERAEWKKNMF